MSEEKEFDDIMKIVIDYNGDLLIERKGVMKTQYCPYMSGNNNYVLCGDNCPHFNEPKIKYVSGDIPFISMIVIELCNNKILTCTENEFTDERKKE
jgi:hypothetical protein